MSISNNALKMCFAAVLTVGLAACGSTTKLDTARDQRMVVDTAISDADTAVAGLSAESTDEEVEAAKKLIQDAKDAVTAATALSMNDQDGLNAHITTIEMRLTDTETNITARDQRMVVDTAISDANTAVAGLSAESTDEEVEAAKKLIQDAKDAVTAATALSMNDQDGLNARITTIEMRLTDTETNINDHRLAVRVDTAVGDADTAVAGLSAESTDEEVEAAKKLIQDAKDALEAANERSVVTPAKATEHTLRITMIERSLDTTETAIEMHRAQVEKDAETQRMADVAKARAQAMQSYMEADAYATEADKAAEAAERTSPGSPGAMAAREAALLARTAADAAEAAHDAITDGMTKAEADELADMAATEAGKANSEYMMAKEKNDVIQSAKAVDDEGRRVSDVEDATEAAEGAAKAARDAATDARMVATNARTAAVAANAAYMRAVEARTDSGAAKMKVDAAEIAATAAEMAATDAEMAADDADAAYMGIDATGSAKDAEDAQKAAEMERDTAKEALDTANEQLTAATTARNAAMEAAGTHVLRLFMAANGAHVMDDKGTPADEKADHVKSVGEAMATISRTQNGNQGSSTAVMITWPGDTVDNPATMGTNEFTEGMLGITVNVAGTTNITAELKEDRAAMDLNGDGDMTDPGEPRIIQTARKIADLGNFQGYELWEDDGNANTSTDRARAILFTNKQKGTDSVLQVIGVTARSVENVAVTPTTLTKLGTKSGDTYTGAEYTPAGDSALTGTLTCPSSATCSVDATTAVNGAVTINSVSGYVFTGSREAREAVDAAEAMENNDYLAFGLWLEEGDNGVTDTFGAFASGGADYDVNVASAVTGTATYSGNAAGAHHKTGEGVNWFHGDARLTANFGTNAQPGTISGAIRNIRVNGDAAMSAPIYLGEANLTDSNATFNGAAFMGAETAPGAPTHEFDGTWSGTFFGPTADDPNTAPLATAGTFGVTKSQGAGGGQVVESFVGAFGAHKE